mmetsp:Transcript_23683/g.36002  ORF Transcript_23683/g.36002 Transcript_23683/m.36002 type:complete len:278 (-) Transcript_23683:241-1074(-)
MKVKNAIAILLGLPLVVFGTGIQTYGDVDSALQIYDTFDSDDNGHFRYKLTQAEKRQMKRDERRARLNPDRTEYEEIQERRRKEIQAYNRDDPEVDPYYHDDFRIRRERARARARAIEREADRRADRLDRVNRREDFAEEVRLEREERRRVQNRRQAARLARLGRQEELDDSTLPTTFSSSDEDRVVRNRREAKRRRVGRRAGRRARKRRAHLRRVRRRRRAAARRARDERKALRRRARLDREAELYDEDGLPITTTSSTSFDGQGTSSFSSSGDVL